MDRRDFIGAAAAASAASVLWLPHIAFAATSGRIAGPFIHENLAVYLVRGPSAPGEVPQTLQEALAAGSVLVHETGDVNRLVIENRGKYHVYVQAGDIVKGGKQDRVLTVSMLLPAGAPPTPIGAYCVEEGRWEKRGREDAKKFTSSDAVVPSREAKLAMKAPASDDMLYRARETGERQRRVWRDVAEKQDKLAYSVGAPVTAPESRSSLQLTLENKRLRETVADYIKALAPLAERETDAVGFVFAINGRLNSADVYPSHGLFVKLWPKLLDAAATEAVAEKSSTPGAPPTAEQVEAFLADAERGPAASQRIDAMNELATRETEKAFYFETRRTDGGWVHRNYIAR